MNWRENLAIGAAVLGLAVGANEMLSVKTPDDYQKYRQQEIVEQGSDATEMDNDRKRDQMRDGLGTENSRKNTPGEVRPADPKLPKLRIRP